MVISKFFGTSGLVLFIYDMFGCIVFVFVFFSSPRIVALDVVL